MDDEVHGPQADGPPEHAPGWVVVVGSSAGGIEALLELLAHLRVEIPLAVVIAQHLSPTHESPLAHLLRHEAALEVLVAVDGTVLRAGTAYVAPPNCDVRVTGSRLVVAPPGPEAGPKPNIDQLFRSAAEAWGDHAVGVVLSGTGTDGSDGLRAIRAAGGTTIAQTPDTAKFDTMPRSAALDGGADLVLDPGEIGEALRRVCRDPVAGTALGSAPGSAGVDGGPPAELRSGRPNEISRMLVAVRAATGIDFAGYKSATVRRQIGRRQAITRTPDLEAYGTLVATDPDEAHALAQRLLVSVSSFFRDPACWTALEPHLADLVDGLDPGEQLRIWVPGCATGEEVYTVAMLVADALGRPADLSRRVKIFATDLDEAALDVARHGRYGADAIAAIPAARQSAWLRPVATGWEVAPVLRDCVVFARHDITVDPPFPRVMLISLRNTLIYFNPELQERVLRWCHFALAPGGLLFTGESERATDVNGLFAAVDGSHRIYQRRALPGGTPANLPVGVRGTGATLVRPSRAGDGMAMSDDDRGTLRDSLIRVYAPPSLVIDDRDDVVEVIGDVAPWCWVADGRHSAHVTALLRAELQRTVRTLLVQVRHGHEPVAARQVTMPDGEVVVTVRRLDDRHHGFAVVSFEPVPSTGGAEDSAGEEPKGPGEGPVDGPRPDQDRRQLAAAQDALQDTVEELAASNEELQALNEEMQASTEELQASSEELSASNEELEATNEELSTLNQELQVRTNELAATSTDMENIQSSINSGIVVVDRDQCIRRFNPLAVRLFALIDADIGRPIDAIRTTAAVPDLGASLREVIEHGTNKVIEVSGADADFLLQVQPYLGADGEVRGALLVATDITALAALQRVVRRSLRDVEHVTDAIREVVWERLPDGSLRMLNRRVEQLYGLDRQAVQTDPALLRAAVHPEDRDRVLTAAAAASGRWQVEYRIVRPDGEIRWVDESAIAVPADGDEPASVVGSALDVTDRHEAEQRAVDQMQVLRTVFDNEVFGVVVLDRAGCILLANDTFAAITGYDVASLAGMALTAIATPDHAGPGASPAEDVLLAGVHPRRLVTRSNEFHWVTLDVRPLGDGAAVGGVLDLAHGQAASTIVIVHDITQLRRTGDELITRARFDGQTGLSNRTYFREQLAQALSRAARTEQSTALLWVDLDGFKEVNDRHGHDAGDLVLHEIAVRLRSLGRRHDLVGRLGGDEFAMLITDVDHVDGVEILVERALASIRQAIDIGPEKVFVSGSIGVAIAPADGAEADELLRNADTAMYGAKSAGRDRHVYFEPRMNELASRRAERHHQLAGALRARDFVMHYQPIVDPATSTIYAAEALARWVRDGQIVSAGEFIPLAEETGQIRALGQIVLDLVRADVEELSTRHGLPDLPITINLSPSQLRERSFVELLLGWDVPGGFGRLIAEVTESVLLDRDGPALEALSLLRRLGTTICIDDFGTGYSNLELLERLQPGIIKLDQSLLRRAESDRRGRALLRASVELTHSLDAAAVLEGIETESQRELAVELGVDWIQGFLPARPMPLDELAVWARRHAAPRPPS